MYKTHVQDYGWSNYISEGVSGTVGKSKRLEAIKMKLDLGSYEGSLNMQLIFKILDGPVLYQMIN